MTESSNPGSRSSIFARDGFGPKGMSLLEFWQVFLRRRAVFFACMSTIVALTMIATFLSTPLYRATTTIEIEPQAPEILTFKDIIQSDSTFFGRQNFYPTQHGILQSRAVLKIAAADLDLVNHPEFVNRKGSPISRLMQHIMSLGRDDAAEKPALSPDAAASFIAGRLRISPLPDSQLVDVSITDSSPELAAEMANAVAGAYIKFQMDARYDTTGKAKEFLTKDVARVQADIRTLERQLQEYGAQNEILGLSNSTLDINEQALADLSSRYTEAKSNLAIAEARYQSVLACPPDAMPEVINSFSVAQLRQQYTELERQHSLMSESFNQDWPPLVRIKGELETVRHQLDREEMLIAEQVRAAAEVDFERAKAEVANLEDQRDVQKRIVQQVNLQAIEYASLKSAIETKRKVLSELVARQSQTETSYRLSETSTSNIRVVDYAEVPKTTFRPRKTLNFFVALILGAMLGGLAAFLVEHLDNTVKNDDDIKRIGEMAVLGHIPHAVSMRLVDSENDPAKDRSAGLDIASHSDSYSEFSEAYRNLRTSLLLATPDHPPRHVVITSPGPSDGKSTAALNLAIVLTQLGRRVLLIDGDLRRPRLHKAIGIANDEGLSNFLSGNAALEDLVRETDIPGLIAISSGPIPPNPSELLGSPRLADILERFREQERFDHVIFDSPPVMSVTDAIILAAQVDSTILVVRFGSTGREALAQSAERLRQSHAKISGAILNAVSEETGYYYARYYRYGAHHRPLSKAGRHGEKSSAGSAKSSRRKSRRSKAG